MSCDFCSSTEVRWRFPAEDFETTVTRRAGSEGGWVACDICHILVDSGDMDALLNRSWDLLSTKCPGAKDFRDVLLVNLRTLHQEFAAHRTGPAHLIGTA
jgi:hypothetical protein